jgi:DNA-binding response OmpR family regulator
MTPVAVIVNTDEQVLDRLQTIVSSCGCSVAALRSFLDANAFLTYTTPDLLIVDLHLAEYNGLQLAIWSQAHRPDVPVIVTHREEDLTAEREAARHGALFVAAPADNAAFVPLVQTLLAQHFPARQHVRHWDRTPLASVIEVNVADARARLLDVSYGGMRLAFNEAREVPETFDITLPAASGTVTVNRVWTAPATSAGPWCCGAEVTRVIEGPWLRFVDAIR